MVWVKRIGVLLATAALVFGTFTVWYVYGTWPEPEGYDFPRHSMWGSGPLALFEGSLQVVDGCIRSGGEQPFTVVWPPGYALALDKGEPVVHGSFREIRMGQVVRMGGGYYETGAPPPTTITVGRCPPPYFLSTGLLD